MRDNELNPDPQQFRRIAAQNRGLLLIREALRRNDPRNPLISPNSFPETGYLRGVAGDLCTETSTKSVIRGSWLVARDSWLVSGHPVALYPGLLHRRNIGRDRGTRRLATAAG